MILEMVQCYFFSGNSCNEKRQMYSPTSPELQYQSTNSYNKELSSLRPTQSYFLSNKVVIALTTTIL